MAMGLMAKTHHENFSFDLRFGIIKGGEATYNAKDTLIDGKRKIFTTLHAYTTGFANLLYGVNDSFESVVQPVTLLPVSSTKQLHEKDYRFSEHILFNHETNMVYSNRNGWHQVEAGICDVSTMIYHLRFSGKLNALKKGQIIEIPFWDTNEWYMLSMKYMGVETVKTRLGSFSCMRLEPMQVSGRFFNKKNPINIWISNDYRKLPVLMELNFTIGSVRCELNKI